MRHDVEDTPEYMNLRASLGSPEMYVLKGLLVSLEHFAIVNAPDGGIGRFDDTFICRSIEYGGDGKELIGMLVKAGWLEPDVKTRLKIRHWTPMIVQSADPEPVIVSTKKKAAKKSPAKKSDAIDLDDSPCYMDGFPLINGEVWCLREKKFDELCDTYRGIDVEYELKKARQWLRDNSQRRKTNVGMFRFLSSWIGRAVDRGNARKLEEPQIEPASVVNTTVAVNTPDDLRKLLGDGDDE